MLCVGSSVVLGGEPGCVAVLNCMSGVVAAVDKLGDQERDGSGDGLGRLGVNGGALALVAVIVEYPETDTKASTNTQSMSSP